MKTIIEHINNSYFKLIPVDKEIDIKIRNILSIQETGYQFNYAFRAGNWDGFTKFYKLENKNLIIPLGLLDLIEKYLNNNNIAYEKINFNDKNDIKNINEEDLREFIKTLNLPFEPFDYQFNTVLKIINNKMGIFNCATNSGKSLIIYIALMYFLKNNKKCIIIVPTISLTLQMEGDFKDYGYKGVCQLIGGENSIKSLDSNLIISTWQSLQHINSNEFKKFDVVMVDECHKAKSDVLSYIIKNSLNSLKFGLTGSIPKIYGDKLRIISVLGNITKVITPRELIERGLATEAEINLLYLNYNENIKKEYRKEVQSYKDEEYFVLKNQKRNSIICKIINKVTLKDNLNSLVLFSKIEHGNNIIKELIKLRLRDYGFDNIQKFIFLDSFNKEIILDLFNNGYNGSIFYEGSKDFKNKILKITSKKFIDGLININELDLYLINGSIKGKKRNEIREYLESEECKNNIIIVASYQTTSTGINFKNLHNIFLTFSSKSYTSITQIIGRGLRKHSSKNLVKIWDFIDDLKQKNKDNYFLAHSKERIEIYLENEYNIKEIELNI